MRVRRTLVAAARGLGIALAVELGSVTLFVLIVVSPALIVVGVGILGLGSLVITERAVAKHTSHIFAKLQLPPSDDDNRRVPAVPAYLDRG